MKKLRVGLVGLPNVGKSSLFKILTNKEILIANYPFSTIDPNFGVVDMQDERINFLKDFFKSEKITLSNFELVDIAGIVRGASQKVGLGGEFLSHIRSLDLVCHVVRCFEDSNIFHVDSKIDALKDFETIQLEFIFADIKQIEKRKEKIQKMLKKENEKKILIQENELLTKIINELNKEIFVLEMNLSENEKTIIENYSFLTNKPSIIIANYKERETKEIEKLKSKFNNSIIFPLEIGLESEYNNLTNEEREYLGWKTFDKNLFFKNIRDSLKLKTFFTAGKTESRAWITELESTAVDCAGLIHSDMKNKFVRVEIYNIDEINNDDFKTKKLRKEPSSYLIKEGDICNFLFSK